MKEKINEIYAAYKKKTKGMTFKEKMVDYIWEYYKIPIVVAIFVIFFLGSYINNAFINPPNKPYSSLSFYGRFVSDSILNNMTSELNNIFIEPESDFEVYSYSFYISENDPELSSMQIQRFAAMVSAKELDIMFVDMENYEIFVSRDYCLPLDELFSQNELQLLDNALIGKEDSDLYYGIDLENYNTDFFERAGFLPKDMLLCVVANTTRQENTANVIRHMLLP